MKKKILIIEDEKGIQGFLKLELEYEGYETSSAYNGRQGLAMALEEDFDLILLDVMLPELNGMEVLRRIRKEKDLPVIMLTAKDATTDKVMGLDIGASDYVTKPFEIEELLARIRGALRNYTKVEKRNEESKQEILLGQLKIDLNQRQVSYADQPISLTKTEFELLLYLVKNKNIALSRQQILEKVWGFDYEGDSNLADVYIRYLRSKIDHKFQVKFIHTVRGVGYIFKDEE